jgi:hypothetical protein
MSERCAKPWGSHAARSTTGCRTRFPVGLGKTIGRLIRASFRAIHGVYGAPRIFLDLREAGEICSKHRVARLMRVNNIGALHGYRRSRYIPPRESVLSGRRQELVLRRDRRPRCRCDCRCRSRFWKPPQRRSGLCMRSASGGDDHRRQCRHRRCHCQAARHRRGRRRGSCRTARS